MCGICGFNWGNSSLIKEMAHKMDHRGPDQEGYYSDSTISLGHKRLSIIDLSEKGKQPMSNEDDSLIIVFNGEIYNFQEIRSVLKEKGHDFKSDSDTEIIIHSYMEWGEDCVKKFNGMWAFCIYDKKNGKLFLSRDRFGKKPLYYYFNNNQFIFGSEIKAILTHEIKKELNKTAVSSFLSYRYVLGEETFFKDIFKLLPAHNLIYDLRTKQIEKNWEYWDIVPHEILDDFETAKIKVDDLLNSSIRYRKISDVPLGVILSGGLDSSLVTAILSMQEKKPINTFTVKFVDEGFDETQFARIVSEKYNTTHFEVILDSSNFLEIMKDYTKYKDEPIGVPNEIPLYLLSKKIRDNVTVVLSGEGADELFEGYGRIFSSARDYTLIKSLKNNLEEYKSKFNSLYKKYNGKFFSSETEHFLSQYKYWDDDEKNLVLKEESKKDFSRVFEYYMKKHNIPYSQKISYLFLKLHLPGLLNRLDSPTMAASIEARAPFLDYTLAEYIFNLPSSFKTKWLLSEEELNNLDKTFEELSENDNISKYLLKEVAKSYLPESIIKRKKQGFPLPLDNWFKGDFFGVTKELLLSENSKIKQVINQENLEKWINNNKESGEKFGQKLWMLLSLELWFREWFPEL